MNCTKHEHYEGKKKPVTGCNRCWSLYRKSTRRKVDADSRVGRLEDTDMWHAASTVVLVGLLIDNLLD